MLELYVALVSLMEIEQASTLMFKPSLVIDFALGRVRHILELGPTVISLSLEIPRGVTG